MKASRFLLGLLLVGFVQLVLCCGTSAKKGSKTPKDFPNKKHRNISASLNSKSNHAKISSARCCKKKLIKHSPRSPPPSTTSTPVAVKLSSTPSGQNIVKATQTTKQAKTSSKAGTLQHLQKETRDDPCTSWMNCPVHHHPQVKVWFRSLPACPCHFFPSSLYDNNTLYDKIQGRLFSWRIVSAKYEMLSVFKPTAKYCIRQLPNAVTTTLATQQCCYDRQSRLITRGSGAGTPNLVAPELDFSMHNEVDLKPFIFCQGDWTRFQAVRSPNNRYNCTSNPGNAEFWRQVKKARDF